MKMMSVSIEKGFLLFKFVKFNEAKNFLIIMRIKRSFVRISLREVGVNFCFLK